MTDAPATNELLAERAKLVAANEAATGWGAAVGARLERIIEIDRQLRAAATPSAQGAEVSVDELARDIWLAGFLRAFDRMPTDPWENQGEAVRKPHIDTAAALLGKYRMEKR